MATISVVIPAYNAELTILPTIESLQQQTFSDFEVIIINDGSTDRTLELLQNFEDPRLKIFSYENGGLSVARNRGLAQATGEFIAFLDADDLWTPDKLELQLAALQKHPEAGLVYSWTYYLDEQTKTTYTGISLFFEGNVQANLLVNNFIASGSNPLIRRQVTESVGEFDTACAGCADWDYWLRISACWTFVVVPKHQIFYRQSLGAMSSKVKAMEEAGLFVIEKAFLAAPPEYQYLKNQSVAWLYEYSTQQYLKHSTDIIGVNQAGQKLWQAIRLHPQILLDNYAQTLLQWLIKKWILVGIKQIKASISNK